MEAKKVTCEICYEEVNESQMFGLKCDHRFCKDCLSGHLETNIQDGNVIKIACMMVGCKEEFESEDVQRFGSRELYQKYLQFKQNIDVELNPNLFWCPRRGCLNYVEKTGKFKTETTCQCGQRVCLTVSYTHLTLPTIYSV